MIIKKNSSWNLKDNQTTNESDYINWTHTRRSLLKNMGAVTIITALYPHYSHANTIAYQRNSKYTVMRALTREEVATTYNNFYEFGSHKSIARQAQRLPTRPWQITIKGLVEKEQTIDIDTILKKITIEERVYRLRCVEAWAMTLPWLGFPMRQLLNIAQPLSSAKYVKMTTFADKEVMPGLAQSWYPWPYTEALTIEEAANDMTFLATGLYGKDIPKQNGAAMRLLTPWKYGFKSIKSIKSFEFTDKRPSTFWESIAPKEYGFWANVNPAYAHPRWSQAEERLVGSLNDKVPTQIYNGYGEFVAELYKGHENDHHYYM